MEKQEMDALLKTIETQVAELIEKKGLKKEDISKEVDTRMEAYSKLNPDELKNVVADFEELKKEHASMKNRFAHYNEREKTLKQRIHESISDESKQKELQDMVNRKSGIVELFTSKAVGNVTTANVTTDTGGNAVLDTINADDLRSLNLKMPFIEEFATVTRTNRPVYVYSDYEPKEGDVGFVAEGATKKQLDLTVKTRTITPVKAAGYTIHSTEVVQDIPRMETESRLLLLRKALLKRQNGILFGDGQNDDPIGVTEVAKVFNPASWTGDAVASPNLHDAIIAAANQIYNSQNYVDELEYYPNVAFVNPGDFASLRLRKDDDKGYLFPGFTLYNDRVIDGMTVVPKKEIPAGKLLVGDFTQLNIINYIDYAVQIGWINDQFIRNLFTMVGEIRFYSFVRKLDEIAFVYDDISNIVAGIDGSGS